MFLDFKSYSNACPGSQVKLENSLSLFQKNFHMQVLLTTAKGINGQNLFVFSYSHDSKINAFYVPPNFRKCVNLRDKNYSVKKSLFLNSGSKRRTFLPLQANTE